MLLSSQTAAKQLRAVLEEAQPRKIVLHAGRVKTGSTFLQAALIENALALAEAGWIFPQDLVHIGDFQSEGRGVRMTGHAILAHIGAGRQINPMIIENFRTNMQGRVRQNLLFSAENLGRDPREGRLRCLATVFDGFDVEVIMYLRRPSSWIDSYYTEQVTGGHERFYQPFEACIDNFRRAAQAAPFLEQLKHWRRPPRITFRNYEIAQKTDGGLLEDFRKLLDLPVLAAPQMANINRSPSFTVARGVRVFNALTRGLSGEDYKALYGRLLTRLERFDDGKRGSFLDPDVAHGIDARWAEDNCALVEGCHMAAEDYAALTAPQPSLSMAREMEPNGHILAEICDCLIENGVTGFGVPPTVHGVGVELRRRVVRGLARRLPWLVGERR